MSATRKLLLSLVALVVLTAAAIGVLRWQADSAAASYPDAVRDNLERYERVYAADQPLRAAAKELAETGKRLPKSMATAEKAVEIGPPAGRLFVANTRILKRETADLPELRSVPLAAVVSPKWKRMNAKAQGIEQGYADALRLSQEAEYFYPRIGAAWARIARVIVLAPVLSRVLKELSELRELATETWGGNPGKDARASIAERLDNDAFFRKIMVSTPVPPAYAARKQAVIERIDRRAEAGRAADRAIRERDRETYDRVSKIYNDNAEADYVGDYLRLCSDLASLYERFDEVAKRLTAQAEAL